MVLKKFFFFFFFYKSQIELWIWLQKAGEFNCNIKFQCSVDELTTHVLWDWSQVTYSESVCCHRFVLTLFEKTVYFWIDCVNFDETLDHAFYTLLRNWFFLPYQHRRFYHISHASDFNYGVSNGQVFLERQYPTISLFILEVMRMIFTKMIFMIVRLICV